MSEHPDIEYVRTQLAKTPKEGVDSGQVSDARIADHAAFEKGHGSWYCACGNTERVFGCRCGCENKIWVRGLCETCKSGGGEDKDAAAAVDEQFTLSIEKWAEDAPPADDLAGLPGELGAKTKADYMLRLAEIRESVEAAASATDTDASDAQREAQNYRMGLANIDGLRIRIENPAGSTRSGVAKDGTEWHTVLKHHYGYVAGTDGFDGDEVDVFVNPEQPVTGKVFVVKQVDPTTGKFDEDKALCGWRTASAAKDAYHANFQDGWKGFGTIEEMSWTKFKEWVHSDAPVNSTFDRSRAGRAARRAAADRNKAASGDTSIRGAERAAFSVSVGEAAYMKRILDRSTTGVEVFSDGLEGETLLAKLNGLIKRPAERTEAVDLNVLPLGHQLEIVDGIVKSVPVFVVNDLLGGELSSKKFLHNETMFEPLPAYSVNTDTHESVAGAVPGEPADVSASAGPAESASSVIHAPSISNDSSNVNISAPDTLDIAKAAMAAGALEDEDFLEKLALLMSTCSIDSDGNIFVDSLKAEPLLKAAVRIDQSYSSTRKEPNNRNGRKWLYSFCAANPDSPLCKDIARRPTT